MWRLLKTWLCLSDGQLDQSPHDKGLALYDCAVKEIPRYPPFAEGLPVVPVKAILASQTVLIDKIHTSLGFNRSTFDQLVLPVIDRYASFVHLLPASESHHHRGAGGLFRHGLEVSYWAARSSEAVIFSIEGTPQQRRDNEPCWRLASCLAGLLHDVGKPLADVSISNKVGDQVWNPYSESLYEWAERLQVERYFIRWRDQRHQRHEAFSLLAVDRLLPVPTRAYLADAGPLIIESMLEAIAGVSVNQPVSRLTRCADQESVARDLKQHRLDVDQFSYGVPVERYVFDCIRRLINNGKWNVNQPGATVWHLHQGVFVVWRNLTELYALIRQDNIPGIPRDPDTLADILIERGFAIPNRVSELGDSAYYRYWPVMPAMLQNGIDTVSILMLRLDSADLVFTSEPPAAVDAVISEETTVEKNVPRQHLEKPLQAEVVTDNSQIATNDLQTQGVESESAPLSLSIGSDNTVSPIACDMDLSPALPEPGLTVLSQVASRQNQEVTVEAATTLRANEPEFPLSSPPSREQLPRPSDEARLALLAIINQYSEAAPLLAQAILPVIDAATPLDGSVRVKNGRVMIRYPEGISHLGSPQTILSTLTEAQVIEPDAVMSCRKIHMVDGIKVIVFVDALSQAIVAAFSESAARAKAADLGTDLGTKTQSSLYQQHSFAHGDDNSVLVTPGHSITGSPADTNDIASKVPRRTAARQQTVYPFTQLSTKPVTQLEQPPHETGSLLSPVINRFEMDDVVHTSTPFANTTSVPLEEQLYLPPVMTPERAISLLKEMIQQRGGRWIVSAVVEENGCLVTSDKAFEVMASEFLGISKHLFSGILRRAQRRPVLRHRQGKLYLEVIELETDAPTARL